MESQWLRDAIGFSLKVSTSTTSLDDGLPGPPEQRDPKFRKLVEGILYSRQLILTYHLVILGIITFVSAINWIGKAIRWRNRRSSRLQIRARDDAYDGDAETIKAISQKGASNVQNSESTSSSGSSTIEGTANPPQKIIDEETPLLHHGHAVYPRRNPVSLINGFLMYQPRPTPLFNKILPSNGSSMAIISLIAINLFYVFFHINFTIFELFVLADRFGLVFVANLPLLYLLAAKNQPLRYLTGQSYESLNIFHRRLGELLCLEALFHAAGMIGVWYTLIRPNGFGFIRFLLLKVILLGLGAFFSYELLYITSLGSFRQRWYELFLGFHIVLQTAALVLVFFHHSASRPYVGVALAIFLIDRLVYRIGAKSTTVEAEASVCDDGETVRISANIVQRPANHLSKWIGRPITSGWQATDHVFMTVPSLSRAHIIQAHPFTIASAAPLEDDDEARLDLLIRAQDGFSADLLKRARHYDHLTVRLDGPYGSSHARTMLEDSGLAIVVAGGSGIAVAWPLIHHLLNLSRSTDTEIAPTSFLRRQKIVLIWVVHKGSHISWLGRQALAEAENRGVDIIIPRATEEIGRPDLEHILRVIVIGFGDEGRKKIGVVASGPDSMGRLIRNTCAKMVCDGRNVDVTIEAFGW